MIKKIKSADDLNILNDQLFQSIDFFFSLMAQTYSKMPGFIGLNLWSGSGSMRHLMDALSYVFILLFLCIEKYIGNKGCSASV